jgi:hypothetical protein
VQCGRARTARLRHVVGALLLLLLLLLLQRLPKVLWSCIAEVAAAAHITVRSVMLM